MDLIDIVELTARLGLPEHDQSAVLSWTGEAEDHLWTLGEADDLADMWVAAIDVWGQG